MNNSLIHKRFILPLSAALVMAGTLGASGIAAAKAPDSFGIAAAVHGQVQLIPAGESAPVTIRSGTAISPGDQLLTGTTGGLQVLMTDNSVFTLGSGTHFTLKRYKYDPVTAEGEMRARVGKGTYKLVTGRVSEENHGKVSVEMPTGTVTSLGTIFLGEANVDGTGEDTVVLLGPGKEKSTSIDKEGVITFEPGTHALESTAETTDAKTGETTSTTGYTIWRAGYAITISSDGSVSEPYEMSGRDFGQMVASIASKGRSGGGEGVDDDVDTAEAEDIGSDEDLLAVDDTEIDTEAVSEGLLGAQDITKIADFEDINGLKGDYLEEGVAMDNGGTFDFRLAFSTDGKDLTTQSMLDYIGFNNIDTVGVTDGELSWDVAGLGLAVDGEPTFDELALNSVDGTLVAKGDCVGVCEGSATVLNAGQGNVAKFYVLELETGDDSYEGTLVKPGGNNNFPGS